MPIFELTLHKTYYNMGFFNVTVDFDQYVGEEGPVKIILDDKQELIGYINRRANQNGTARVMGGAELRDWFQANFHVIDRIDVDLSKLDVIRLKGSRK